MLKVMLLRMITILLFLISIPFLHAEDNEVTIRVLTENSDAILEAAKSFHVPVRLLVSAIYADRRMHYNILDTRMDVAIARKGRDNSIGLAQVRVSTAQWVSQTLRDRQNPYWLGEEYDDLLTPVMDRDSVIVLLSDPKWNARFAAAYSAMILKRWRDRGFDISEKVEIFATLYNLGPYRKDGTEREPHENAEANEYGYVARDFYYLN